MSIYEQASNARLNMSKSEGIILDVDNRLLRQLYEQALSIKWHNRGDHFRMLGFFMEIGDIDLEPE